MAERNWRGGTAGNPNNAGTAANWAEASAPADGDSVVIDYGSYDITAGLDQSAINLVGFYRGPNYKGRLGNSAADPLKYEVSGTLAIDAAAGTQSYLDCGATGAWDVATIDAEDASALISLIASIANPQLHLLGGTVRLESGTFTNIYMDPGANRDDRLSVTALNITCTLLEALGGNLVVDHTSAAITTLRWAGGVCRVQKGNPTNVECWRSGSGRGRGGVIWNTADAGTDTIVKVRPGGVFDCSQDKRPKTLDTVYRWRGSVFLGDAQANSITVTNGQKTPAGVAITGDINQDTMPGWGA